MFSEHMAGIGSRAMATNHLDVSEIREVDCGALVARGGGCPEVHTSKDRSDWSAFRELLDIAQRVDDSSVGTTKNHDCASGCGSIKRDVVHDGVDDCRVCIQKEFASGVFIGGQSRNRPGGPKPRDNKRGLLERHKTLKSGM